MYLVEETFKYLVEDKDSFTSVENVLDICNSFPACVWENTINPLPVSSNDSNYPWGNSDLKISKSITINPEKLARLIRTAEFGIALANGGVSDWEFYNEALSSYEEEFGDITDKTDAEVIKII